MKKTASKTRVRAAVKKTTVKDLSIGAKSGGVKGGGTKTHAKSGNSQHREALVLHAGRRGDALGELRAMGSDDGSGWRSGIESERVVARRDGPGEISSGGIGDRKHVEQACIAA